MAQRFSRKRRIFILEDAAYRELRYEGPDLPSIKSFDHDNSHVILALTFSKPCAPGLKTGYGFLPHHGHQSFIVPFASAHLPVFEPHGRRLRDEGSQRRLARRQR